MPVLSYFALFMSGHQSNGRQYREEEKQPGQNQRRQVHQTEQIIAKAKKRNDKQQQDKPYFHSTTRLFGEIQRKTGRPGRLVKEADRLYLKNMIDNQRI